MQIMQTVAPAQEPVSLTEAKLHLRVEHDEEDALIGALIIAAREQAEFLTGQRLITQTWTVSVDSPQAVPLYGLTPIQSVSADGVSIAIDGLLPPTLTVDAPGSVTLVCGFGNADDVPASIRQWMLLRLGALYEQRESIGASNTMIAPLHSFADALLDPYIVPRA